MKTCRYALTTLFQGVATGLLIPVLSLLFTSRGLSLTQLATGMLLYSGVTLVLELPSGVLADSLGRKRCYLVAELVRLVGCALWFHASYPTLCAACAVMGAGNAVGSGSFDALFIDRYLQANGEDSLRTVSTVKTVCETVGYAAGSLAGGVLLVVGRRMFGRSGMCLLPISLKLVCHCVQILLVSTLIETDRPSARGCGRSPLDILRESGAAFRGAPVLVVVLSCVAFTGFLLSGVESFWQPRLEALLPEPGLVWLSGVLGFLYFFCCLLGSLAGDRLLRWKTQPAVVFFIGRCVSAAMLYLLAKQYSVFGFFIVYMILYMSIGCAGLAETVLVNRNTPANVRATILSVQSLTVQGGALLAISLAASLVGSFGIPRYWAIVAGIFMFSCLAGAVAYRVQVTDTARTGARTG